MKHVNRAVAIIRPRQPYVDWANSLPDAGRPMTVDDLQSDCLAVLIPAYDTDDEARHYVNDLAQEIFECKLWAWCTNEDWWPKHRTRTKFWEWFHVELHSEVLDPFDDPIDKEDE